MKNNINPYTAILTTMLVVLVVVFMWAVRSTS